MRGSATCVVSSHMVFFSLTAPIQDILEHPARTRLLERPYIFIRNFAPGLSSTHSVESFSWWLFSCDYAPRTSPLMYENE